MQVLLLHRVRDGMSELMALACDMGAMKPDGGYSISPTTHSPDNSHRGLPY